MQLISDTVAPKRAKIEYEISTGPYFLDTVQTTILPRVRFLV
jgi:hypothetical protein